MNPQRVIVAWLFLLTLSVIFLGWNSYVQFAHRYPWSHSLSGYFLQGIVPQKYR